MDESSAIPDISHRRLLIKRYLQNKMFVIGGSVVVLYLIAALFSPYLTRYDPNKMNFASQLKAPSVEHFMGTDQYGRDVYTRIVYGTRVSLIVAAVSVLIGAILGVVIGAISGFMRGHVDSTLMRMMDGLLAFPPLLLALGLVASMGPGLKTMCISIGIIYIPTCARVMRGSVLAEREKEYVEAARAVGQSNVKILLKHVVPSCLSPILVQSTILFAAAIIIEASLSFLGVGIPPPTPSLGTILDEARQILGLPGALFMAFFPGVAISLAVLGFNLLGDGLRDILDPRIYTETR
jgi:ABC-type dipeptide/oligopeptide/nickel transport system permease subunit